MISYCLKISLISVLFFSLTTFFGCGLIDKEEEIELPDNTLNLGGNAGLKGNPTNPSGTTKTITDSDKTAASSSVTAGKGKMEEMGSTLSDPSTSNIRDLNVPASSALTEFESAIEKNPNNTEAQFGAAACKIIVTTQDPTFLEMNDSLEKWSGGPVAMAKPTDALLPSGKILEQSQNNVAQSHVMLMKMIQSASNNTDNAFNITKLQDFVDEKLLVGPNALIPYILDRLSIIENDPNFTFLITPAMYDTTATDTIEIDLGEIYMLDASIRLLRSFLFVFTAYNLDIYNPEFTAVINDETCNDSLESAYLKWLDTQSGFLTLRNDKTPTGRTKMENALSSARSTILKIKAGITFIRNELDEQSNDVIKKSYITEADQTITEEGLNPNADQFIKGKKTIEDVLTEIDLLISSDYTVTADFDSNSATAQGTLVINISNWFMNPVDDFKKLIPYHVWVDPSQWTLTEGIDVMCHYDTIYKCDTTFCREINGEVVRLVNKTNGTLADTINYPIFPDYTLGRLFPNMTPEKWSALLGKNIQSEEFWNDDNTATGKSPVAKRLFVFPVM